jgi:hypothetical protein
MQGMLLIGFSLPPSSFFLHPCLEAHIELVDQLAAGEIAA